MRPLEHPFLFILLLVTVALLSGISFKERR